MRLWQTRRHWEKLARDDALWAVLSEPDKRDGAWRREEFFRTGVDEVAADLTWARSFATLDTNGTALDFGCGVGRLTQALARHFPKVVGVDIAEAMLALARRYDERGDAVAYVHNAEPDLRLFGDAQFCFVYSLITLQHMAPEYARRYITEFVRVTVPGGAILFQVPTATPRAKRRGFTLWPDTLYRRLRRHVRCALALEAVMEMHALTQEEVMVLLASAGARLIATRPGNHAGSEIPSLVYLAKRES